MFFRFVFILCLLNNITFAQQSNNNVLDTVYKQDIGYFKKHQIMLVGSLSFNNSNSGKTDNYWSFSINPVVHYFLFKRLALGAGIMYNYLDAIFVDLNTNKTVNLKMETFAVIPQIRYYLISKSLLPVFVEVDYSYGITRALQQEPKVFNTLQMSRGIGIGVNYIVLNTYGLELSLTYNHSLTRFKDFPNAGIIDTTNTISFPNIGLTFLF